MEALFGDKGGFFMKPTLWLTLSVLVGISLPAAATTGRVYQDLDGAVTVYGLTPGTRVHFGVDAPPVRRLTTDSCGTLNISQTSRYPRATVQVNGSVINPDTLTTRIRPPCRQQSDNSYALDEARPSPYLNSKNGFVLVPNLTPNTRYEITYPGLYRVMRRKVNACGFLRVRETNTLNFNNFLLLPTVTSNILAEFRINEIPALTGLVCYRSHLYYPADWAGWPETEAIAGSEVSESAISSSGVASSPSGSLAAEVGSGGDSGSGSGGGTTGDGSTGDGTTGDGSSGGTTGDGTSGGGTTGDDGSGGTSPDPAIHDFTAATYDPTLHDYNGDDLVDDVTGDGIADDRDGDGHLDGPWGPNDAPRSAGPGYTLPPGASVCLGHNGNLVASSPAFIRGRSYYLTADDGLPNEVDDPLEAAAASGAPTGDPVARFAGDYRSSNFNHGFEGSGRHGYIGRDDYFDSLIAQFEFPDVPSCLVPSWLNDPPSWISQANGQ